MNWQRVVEDFMEEVASIKTAYTSYDAHEAFDAVERAMRRLMRAEEERCQHDKEPPASGQAALEAAIADLHRFNIETLKGTIDIYADLLRREMQETTRLRAKLEQATR